MKVLLNHLFFFLCAGVGILSALPPSIVDFVPPTWKPYVVGAVLGAAWIKSHKNLFFNPDGTPAICAWIKPDNTDPKV
jgi:hypothetical protein